jgi:hypothetical protein
LLEACILFTLPSDAGLAVVLSSDFPGFDVVSSDSPLSLSVELSFPFPAFVSEELPLADFEGVAVVALAAVVTEAESDFPVEAGCFPPAPDVVDPAAVVAAEPAAVVAAALPAVVAAALPSVVTAAFPAVVEAAPAEAAEVVAPPAVVVDAPAAVVADPAPLVAEVVSFFSLLSFFSSFPI